MSEEAAFFFERAMDVPIYLLAASVLFLRLLCARSFVGECRQKNGRAAFHFHIRNRKGGRGRARQG